MEVGLKADYNAKIAASAESLTSDYEAQIANLKNGDIATMKSSITQNANQIALKASQSSVDSLTGRVSSAEAKFDLYVLETELGELVSKIEISADQIDLQGVVTYQMLNGTLQNTIDGKAEDSEVTALNNSISSLNGTIQALQTEVDGKASTTSLNNKVNELNTALKNKADSDLTNAVVEGSTLIVGGYINTDVIDVDSLVVKKLKATKETSSGQYIYTLDANGFLITDSDGDTLSELYVNNNWGYFTMRNNDSYFTMNANSLMFAGTLSSDGVTSISKSGLNLAAYSAISGLAIGNIDTGQISRSTDFIVMTTNLTLPGASSSNKGKIIFVKFDGSHTLYGSIIKRHEKDPSTSSSHSYAMSAFYISNGTYWYEFLSNLN